MPGVGELLAVAAPALVGAAAGYAIGARPGWNKRSDIPRGVFVETDETLCAEADVVVAGAGIAGIATAIHLAEKGMQVLVCDKGLVAGEQSSRAFGWVYSTGWHRDLIEFAEHSKRLWNGYNQRFGLDVGFRAAGNYRMLNSEPDIEHFKSWLQEAPDIGARLITNREEVSRLLPGVGKVPHALVHQPSDGTAEATYSVARLAHGAIGQGVKIVSRCAVRGIETEAGQLSEVVTERGRIRTKALVVAAGAWSRLFLGNIGVDLPQLGTASSLQRVSAVDGPMGCGDGGGTAWVRHIDGTYSIGVHGRIAPITLDSVKLLPKYLKAYRKMRAGVHVRFGPDFLQSLLEKRRWSNGDVSPFEQNRFLSAGVQEGELSRMLTKTQSAFPAFKSAKVIERWAGIIDITPDATPVISSVPTAPGVFINTGLSGSGLTSGPAAGQMMADIVAGDEPATAPGIFRLGRFSDGSKTKFRK